MDLHLAGKVVLVAGASRGIGMGIAETCLAEGAKVALTARGKDALDQAKARLADRFGVSQVWSFCGDMRRTADIEMAVEHCESEFGPIWGAVANVGIHPCPNGFNVDDETWDQGLAQNLTASYRFARSCLMRMSTRGEGSIVFISSIAGVDALGTPLTYGTSKAAINHLSQELAKVTGRSGIRVNTIAPGNIIFSGGSWEKNVTGERADSWKRWISREVPMNRFGKPEEIGAVAAFLLSTQASFVTGAVIPVDGGQVR